jgi:mannose-6-phosphate isomerase-like protein (cupin superfamily)
VSGTFAIIQEDEVAAERSDPTFGTAPGITSVRRLSPPDYDLWLCVLELDDGARLTFPPRHGEEGLYVLAGELEVEGRPCPTRGAVVVESDVALTVGVRGPSRVVHVGSTGERPPQGGELGPAATTGHGVHVVGPEGWYVSGTGVHTVSRWFADSTCPTCRIAFFDVKSDETPGRSRQHTHSADEIIYVMEGTMRLGRRLLGPGTSLCIGGGTRYAQSAGPGGCTFLNFRRDTSQQQYYGPGEPDHLLPENALGRGGRFVGDVEHLRPAQQPA